MRAPVHDGELLHRRHTRNVEQNVWETLGQKLHSVPNLIRESTRVIVDSTRRPIDNFEDVVNRLLRSSGLSPKLAPAIMAAYAREPNPSAFGVAQALTDARMITDAGLTPEEAHTLEDAAGNYLRNS
jgi:hypothetical protein